MNLDTLRRMTENPEMLNALHACREGHPLNRATPHPWANAYALACQRPLDFSGAAIDWLRWQAATEAALRADTTP